jgi:hypothetical protein
MNRRLACHAILEIAGIENVHCILDLWFSATRANTSHESIAYEIEAVFYGCADLHILWLDI